MKENSYQVLISLQDELQNLFEKIGYDSKYIRLQTNNKFMKIIGEEIPFKYLKEYINELQLQIIKSSEVYENKRLEQYSISEEKIESLKEKEDEYKCKIRELESQMEQYANLVDELKVKNQELETKYEDKEKSHYSAVEELISLSDSLELRYDAINDSEEISDDVDFKKIASQTADRTNKSIKKILKISGVEEIKDNEKFDPKKHSVISTIQTEDKELHDTIAKTVRSGYVYGEKHIRNQEVILYLL
ncbi:MAG: nucleotide exchange factor GrpE [Clostridia bacterium]